MPTLVRPLLRGSLLVLLIGSVLVQALVPLAASEEGSHYPEVAHLVVPYSIAGILVVGCLQAALLIVWRLLSLIDDGAIFTRPALRLVDAITVFVALATLLAAAPLVHLLAFAGLGGPGVVLGLAAGLACGVALVLLILVMRSLLEAAIADRAELDGVI